jgi:hypothetical protein
MENTEIILKVERKRIKAGDLRKAQRDDIDANMRLIASCMVEPDGTFMDREKALAILDELDLEIIETEITPKLFEAVEVARNATLPLPNARR